MFGTTSDKSDGLVYNNYMQGSKAEEIQWIFDW